MVCYKKAFYIPNFENFAIAVYPYNKGAKASDKNRIRSYPQQMWITCYRRVCNKKFANTRFMSNLNRFFLKKSNISTIADNFVHKFGDNSGDYCG